METKKRKAPVLKIKSVSQKHRGNLKIVSVKQKFEKVNAKLSARNKKQVPRYYEKNGLRYVKPYYINFINPVKKEWEGRTFKDVYTSSKYHSIL